jgi:hypothetical protein
MGGSGHRVGLVFCGAIWGRAFLFLFLLLFLVSLGIIDAVVLGEKTFDLSAGDDQLTSVQHLPPLFSLFSSDGGVGKSVMKSTFSQNPMSSSPPVSLNWKTAPPPRFGPKLDDTVSGVR